MVDDLRNLADWALFLAVVWAQWNIGVKTLAFAKGRQAWVRNLIRLSLAVVDLWLLAGVALQIHPVVLILEPNAWLRGAVGGSAFVWMFATTGGYLVHELWPLMFSP